MEDVIEVAQDGDCTESEYDSILAGEDNGAREDGEVYTNYAPNTKSQWCLESLHAGHMHM